MNNRDSGLHLTLSPKLGKTIRLYFLALANGDIHQGLRIGIQITEYCIPDAIVFDKNIGCFELLRGEGLRWLRF